MRNLCRTCLKPCYKKQQKIDEITMEIMNILLLKPNLDVTDDPALCSKCAETLQKCFSFKSTCFYTEEFLFPFINSEYDPEMKLDLKELYVTTQSLERLNISPFKKICRLCMELVSDKLLTPLYDLDSDMMHKCLPEVNFMLTKEPVICNTCHDFLKIYMNFIDTCVQTEQKINRYCQIKGANKRGKVSLTDVSGFSEKVQCDKEIINNLIIDIVPDIKSVEQEKTHNAECPLIVETCLEDRKIEYKAKKKSPPQYHYTKEEIKRRKYACHHCPFRTKFRKSLHLHSMIHIDLSQLEWHYCDTCTYRTTQKGHFARHIATHGEPKKCPLCDYQDRHSSRINSHMRKHTKTYMYHCEACPFQTKYINSFRRHSVRHKDISQLQFLHCAECEFKTLRKDQLTIHMMKAHTDPSKSFRYRCVECTYTTVYKGDYNKHMLSHKKRTETTVYKCNECKYEAIFKNELKMHELKHKQPSFECSMCPYKARRPSNLKSHMLKHKKRSEIQLFECAICGQTCKTKENIRRHILQRGACDSKRNKADLNVKS